MAKSSRASSRKANVVLKKKKLAPILAVTDKKRSIRLQSYACLQKVQQAGEEMTEEIDTKVAEAAAHATILLRNDDQKNDLREKGRFFFVHPHHNKDETFPVVANPDGKIDEYRPVIPEEERDPGVTKKKFKRVYKSLDKKKKRKRIGANIKRF